MLSINSSNCYKCNKSFAELDSPIKCDGCKFPIYNKCSGLSVNEIKCLSLKNRGLKYFCEPCNNGLRDIPELKQLINRLLIEVNDLKSQKSLNNGSQRSEEFIIYEINERNIRASYLLIYNVPESTSINSTDRLAHDSNLVNDFIKVINNDNNITIPLKVIHLGKPDQNKTRPIKAIFPSPADVFYILKAKKKLLLLQPPSPIRISSDRTLFQRNVMKKLYEELESRRNNGETDLIIKYVKGSPEIVSKNNHSNTRFSNAVNYFL